LIAGLEAPAAGLILLIMPSRPVYKRARTEVNSRLGVLHSEVVGLWGQVAGKRPGRGCGVWPALPKS